jgi:hypothetical protein
MPILRSDSAYRPAHRLLLSSATLQAIFVWLSAPMVCSLITRPVLVPLDVQPEPMPTTRPTDACQFAQPSPECSAATSPTSAFMAVR